MGGYTFSECKGKQEQEKDICYTIVTNVAGAAEVVSASCIVSSSVCFARDLANKPGQHAYASGYGKSGSAYGGKNAVWNVKILDAAQMQAKNMNAVLAVGQGSVNPPYMAVLKYNGGRRLLRTLLL